MRKFDLVAGYYEWHLIDTETHETLHNLIDPSELLYHEDGSPLTKDEIESWCKEELISADIAYSEDDGKDQRQGTCRSGLHCPT